MRDSGIGRVLVASLHQAIGDLLPTRLAFYESFLAVQALREGTIGLAPLSAVLSFLRQEGADYDRIMTRAGELAAEWTVESMAPIERSAMASAPPWLRARLALRLARQLVRQSCAQSRAVSRLRKKMARVEILESVFCTVREPAHAPLCGYYAAACRRLLGLFALPAVATTTECRGCGQEGCAFVVSLVGVAEDVVNEAPAA